MGGTGEKLVLLGRIVGVHGVRGELKLESYTDPRMRIFRYQPWQLGTGSGVVQVAGCQGRAQGKGIVATLPGIDDRDAAAALVGSDIRVPRAALPPAAPGEYYWADLEGLEVVTMQGVPAVLLSGDHAAIRRWRLQQSLGRTWLRRPDLLGKLAPDKEMQALLAGFQAGHATPTTTPGDGSGE